MTRDDFLAKYRGTIWEGGARYWRGRVMYRPTWTIVDLVWREHQGYWPHGRPPGHWAVVMERIDNNSASEPRGFRQTISVANCLRGFGPYPDTCVYTMLDGVRSKVVA